MINNISKIRKHVTNLYEKGLENRATIENLQSFNQTFPRCNLEFGADSPYPCFFTGNLSIERPIVTISLNPKYDPHLRETQGETFERWFENSMHGFRGYPNDQRLHPIWKSLRKGLFSQEQVDVYTEQYGDRAHCEILYDNVINIDWCYYYSNNFPTITQLNWIRNQIFQEFDQHVSAMIDLLNPRYVFIHGKSLAYWWNENTRNHELLAELYHGRHIYTFEMGKYKNTETVVFYQNWSVSRANKSENLQRIQEIIAGINPK